jgi:hypothetical protein
MTLSNVMSESSPSPSISLPFVVLTLLLWSGLLFQSLWRTLAESILG